MPGFRGLGCLGFRTAWGAVFWGDLKVKLWYYIWVRIPRKGFKVTYSSSKMMSVFGGWKRELTSFVLDALDLLPS